MKFKFSKSTDDFAYFLFIAAITKNFTQEERSKLTDSEGFVEVKLLIADKECDFKECLNRFEESFKENILLEANNLVKEKLDESMLKVEESLKDLRENMIKQISESFKI